jgi:hypothetical protein
MGIRSTRFILSHERCNDQWDDEDSYDSSPGRPEPILNFDTDHRKRNEEYRKDNQCARAGSRKSFYNSDCPQLLVGGRFHVGHSLMVTRLLVWRGAVGVQVGSYGCPD